MVDRKQIRENLKLWGRLLLSMFKIGFVGFGGGNALVPIIEESMVRQGLVSEDDFEEDVVVANITPGALPVELASGIGKRVLGRRGLLAAAMAVAAPGVVLTVALLLLVNVVGKHILLQFQYLTIGITAGIACLLTDYVTETLGNFSKRRYRGGSIVVILAVFALTCGDNLVEIFDWQIADALCLSTQAVFALAFFIIFYTNCTFHPVTAVVSAVIGLLYLLHDSWGVRFFGGLFGVVLPLLMIVLSIWGLQKNFTREQKIRKLPLADIFKDLILMLIVLALAFVLAVLVMDRSGIFLKNGVLSSLMSFGGGDAYLTVADALFVRTHLVSSYKFYSLLVPIANILPGSILCKVLSGVGFLIGYTSTGSIFLGLVGATSGFLVSVAASCGIFSMVGDVYRSFRDVNVFQNLKKWIRPIVAGLMLTVITTLIYQNCQLGVELKVAYMPVILMGVIYAVAQFLRKKKLLGGYRLFAFSALVSLVVCNLAWGV